MSVIQILIMICIILQLLFTLYKIYPYTETLKILLKFVKPKDYSVQKELRLIVKELANCILIISFLIIIFIFSII